MCCLPPVIVCISFGKGGQGSFRRIRPWPGTINEARYSDTLSKLKPAIGRKRSGFLSREVLFLNDNATPNTARDTIELIRRLGWDRLGDSNYSSDLFPSDFHHFPASKSALSGRHFRSNGKVRWL
ncbi:hypothetical protein AVEN_83715-1 [Araneus ventricosus]|uniref:Tc1-like transposase DDE domain-containing protein n=1 Tax=Araneus ventricosus TaxID=182803 RepID=A0A4Y2EU04_ARAVE|nr:hypothetical protein AVEN_83715-1 [Araneus ventricosus]